MIEADIYVAYHTSSEKSSLWSGISILIMGVIVGTSTLKTRIENPPGKKNE
jgi:hypothetical protein